MDLNNPQLDRRTFCTGSALLLSVPTALGLVGCTNSGQNNTAEVNDDLVADTDESATSAPSGFDGNFIVGFDEEFPPYGYVDDDGGFTGFDLDLAEMVCKENGWNFTPTPIAWDAKDALLNSGQITCIWNGFTIEGREDDYAFTDPYMENRQVMVVREDSAIASLAELAGKRVVTQADSAALELLSEDGEQEELGASFAVLDTIGEYNTAFMMLEQGSYDAVAVDYPVAVFNLVDRGDALTILDEPLNSEHFGVGFADTDAGRQLAASVQQTLQALDADGKVAVLCDTYADQGISYDLWCLPKN